VVSRAAAICDDLRVLARWGIRLAASLIGIAAGIILAVAVLADVSATTVAVVKATAVFWVVHLVVNFIALRILIRNPSLAVAGLLALVSTIVSLVIVNIIVTDLKIHGTTAYVVTTLIIWVTTAVADTVGRSRIRERRRS
jgi:hypothetical protein